MLEHEYQTAKYTILHSQNLNAIPALLELILTEDNEAYVTQALLRLLPNVSREQAAIFGMRQHRILYDMLQHSYALELRLAIVDALGKIGTHDVLHVLHPVLLQLNLPVELTTAIEQCRATIIEREQQAHNQQTLLRASGNIQKPETLLRASQPVAQVLPDDLLRPHIS